MHPLIWSCRRSPLGTDWGSFFLILLVTWCGLPAGLIYGQTATEHLAQCDAAYEANDLDASRQAAEAALAADANSASAYWKLSRALIEQGNLTDNKQQRLEFYENARLAAQQAVDSDAADSWARSYLAAAVGKLALFHGGKKKIELSKIVRDQTLRAIELDPRNDMALHILARWNREVANLGMLTKLAAKVVYGGVPKGASNENAVRYFRDAIAVQPANINHHLELGFTYMKMRQYTDAITEFETVLNLPEDTPSDSDYKQQAQKELKKAQRRLEEAAEDEF